MTKFLSVSKKHQATRSRTYRPSTSGVKAYSHSKAVHASFSVAWKNAAAKAPYSRKKLVQTSSREDSQVNV